MRKKRQLWGYEDTRKDLISIKGHMPDKTLTEILDDAVKQHKQNICGDRKKRKNVFPKF